MARKTTKKKGGEIEALNLPDDAILGYARTSTVDQHLGLQTDALTAAGAVNIFTDQVSGASRKRPGLDAMLAAARPGHTVIVWKLDRLGRDAAHVILTVDDLRQRGVRLKSITEAIDSETPHGRLLLGIFATLAEYERALIRERITAGIARRKREGGAFGRPRLVTSDVLAHARELREQGKTWTQISRLLHVGRSTILEAVARDDIANGSEKRPIGKPRKVHALAAE